MASIPSQPSSTPMGGQVEQQQMFNNKNNKTQLPMKDIPGGYGLPVLGPIKDRLDFFWFQGETEFWASRRKKYNSTVFRCNVPPSPPAFPANKVIMLLDQKSYPVLFDMDKVVKKDILLANYVTNTAFFGGFRPCAYLDPSEERHTKLKAFVMQLLKINASRWIPDMQSATAEVFSDIESAIAKDGKLAFSSQTATIALSSLIKTLMPKADLANSGITATTFLIWLGPQLIPIASLGLPHLLEELLLHNIRLPFFLVSLFYSKIVSFFRKEATELLDMAEKEFGIESEDALHNIIFFVGFNAFGGLQILLPWVLSYVGTSDAETRHAMVKEARAAVAENGSDELTVAALAKMPLLRSVVYETLRMAPPVPYQYAVAKQDIEIESYDARFAVKKGEILGGCQPIASRDPVVFGDDANTFNAKRFVGEEAERLLGHVLWGNGPATAEASTANKLCAANRLVPLLAQAMLATFLLRYDDLTCSEPVVKGNSVTHTITSLTPRSATSS